MENTLRRRNPEEVNDRRTFNDDDESANREVQNGTADAVHITGRMQWVEWIQQNFQRRRSHEGGKDFEHGDNGSNSGKRFWRRNTAPQTEVVTPTRAIKDAFSQEETVQNPQFSTARSSYLHGMRRTLSQGSRTGGEVTQRTTGIYRIYERCYSRGTLDDRRSV